LIAAGLDIRVTAELLSAVLVVVLAGLLRPRWLGRRDQASGDCELNGTPGPRHRRDMVTENGCLWMPLQRVVSPKSGGGQGEGIELRYLARRSGCADAFTACRPMPSANRDYIALQCAVSIDTVHTLRASVSLPDNRRRRHRQSALSLCTSHDNDETQAQSMEASPLCQKCNATHGPDGSSRDGGLVTS